MACGDENDSGCGEVLSDVWSFLDDELDPAKRAAVKQHLDGCSPCLQEAGIDEKLKSILHEKCGGERAPQELRARLQAALRDLSERPPSTSEATP